VDAVRSLDVRGAIGGGQEEGQSNDAFRPVDPGAEVLQLLRALQILYLNL
jgi:hypothetical protein